MYYLRLSRCCADTLLTSLSFSFPRRASRWEKMPSPMPWTCPANESDAPRVSSSSQVPSLHTREANAADNELIAVTIHQRSPKRRDRGVPSRDTRTSTTSYRRRARMQRESNQQPTECDCVRKYVHSQNARDASYISRAWISRDAGTI